jgi:B-cell receptor-associated protein 31
MSPPIKPLSRKPPLRIPNTRLTNNPPTQILETLKLETKLKQYEGDAKASGQDGAKLEQAGKGAEIGNLRKKLEQKDRDLENLKMQADQLNKEYRELSDKYAATQPDKTPKKDR